MVKELAVESGCSAHSGVKELVGVGWKATAEGEDCKLFLTSPFSIASST